MEAGVESLLEQDNLLLVSLLLHHLEQNLK